MSKYRKALKNYTSSSPLNKMISDIQQILIDFGATGVGFEYTEGRISGIGFKIEIEGNSRVINVPLMIGNVSEVLRQQRQYKNEDHSYRVAIANTRDWLDSQLAYLATQQVKFEQIFLPYMVDPSMGKTFYEIVSGNKFSLGSPK